MLKDELPGLQEIYLEVEAIATNKKWLFSLCEQLEAFNSGQEEPIGYWCNFRVTKQSVDPAVFRALKKANFIRINIGLESGSERVRREILKRDYSNESFLRAVSLARDNGMEVNIYNLIGIPGETRMDHMETVRINQLARPDGVYTSIFFPYPGTELYDVCIAQGLISGSIDARSERRKSVLDLPGFSRREIQHAYIWFQYRIFRGRRSLAHCLRKVVEAMLDSHYRTRALFWKLLPLLRILKRLATFCSRKLRLV